MVPIPDELNMDFGQYRIDPPIIDRDYYYSDITLSPYNLQLDFTPFKPDFTALAEKVSAMQTIMENAGQTTANYIDEHLPGFLSGDLKTRIKDSLIISLDGNLAG